MVFSSLTFLLLFLPILLLLYFAVPHRRWRNGVLILGSLFFYGWGEPVWILAMLFSTLVNYLCALLIDRARSRFLRGLCLTLGVLASISFLVYFKYSAFFGNMYLAVTGSARRLTAPGLPIGISFYTFQILTYTVDVYRRKAPVQKNPARLLLYVSCFPQLIAGPIVQYADVAGELRERRIAPRDFTEGMQRFVLGLGKKVLIANLCAAALADLVPAGSGTPMSLLGGWLGAALYALQIYFDFSAYSDMAIGLGRVLGFHYKENFDFPYASASITEFWRRWHISLGSFFRDYVYIPLGGNRHGAARTILNMSLVWALTGLWHGASWNFVLWGVYYGVLLVLERFPLRRSLGRIPAVLRWLPTQLFVLIGWVIFYYESLPAVGEHLLSLVGCALQDGSPVRAALTDEAALGVLRQYGFFPLAAWVLSLPFLPKLCTWLRKSFARPVMELFRGLFYVAVLALSVMFLIGQSYNPFIYFRF